MAETAEMQRIFFKIAMKAKIQSRRIKPLHKPDTIVAEINRYNIFASNSGRGAAARIFFFYPNYLFCFVVFFIQHAWIVLCVHVHMYIRMYMCTWYYVYCLCILYTHTHIRTFEFLLSGAYSVYVRTYILCNVVYKYSVLFFPLYIQMYIYTVCTYILYVHTYYYYYYYYYFHKGGCPISQGWY